MRREYNISDSYIDYLKSLGCVLYLPLGADGDLKDYISGNSLVPTGTGSIAWDNTIQMYVITTPNSYNVKIATLDSLIPTSDWSADIVSGSIQMQKVSNSGYSEIFCVGTFNDCLYPVAASQKTDNMSYWSNRLHDSGMIYKSNKRIWYEDGAQARTDTIGSRAPHNWTSKEFFIGSSSSNTRNTSIAVANVMLFNKELALADYRKINGYA